MSTYYQLVYILFCYSYQVLYLSIWLLSVVQTYNISMIVLFGKLAVFGNKMNWNDYNILEHGSEHQIKIVILVDICVEKRGFPLVLFYFIIIWMFILNYFYFHNGLTYCIGIMHDDVWWKNHFQTTIYKIVQFYKRKKLFIFKIPTLKRPITAVKKEVKNLFNKTGLQIIVVDRFIRFHLDNYKKML